MWKDNVSGSTWRRFFGSSHWDTAKEKCSGNSNFLIQNESVHASDVDWARYQGRANFRRHGLLQIPSNPDCSTVLLDFQVCSIPLQNYHPNLVLIFFSSSFRDSCYCLYIPFAVFDRLCFYYSVRNSLLALLETLFAPIYFFGDLSVLYFFFWLVCVCVCQPFVFNTHKTFFHPSQPGSFAWLSPFLLCANYTCVLVCVRIYMRVCVLFCFINPILGNGFKIFTIPKDQKMSKYPSLAFGLLGLSKERTKQKNKSESLRIYWCTFFRSYLFGVSTLEKWKKVRIHTEC